MQEVVESNVYRVTQMCSNCPFKDNGKSIQLNEGRVEEIKEMLLEGTHKSFNCHKTVYNLDVNMEPYQGTQELKMCAGAYEFLKKQGKPNAQMQIAKRLGIE